MKSSGRTAMIYTPHRGEDLTKLIPGNRASIAEIIMLTMEHNGFELVGITHSCYNLRSRTRSDASYRDGYVPRKWLDEEWGEYPFEFLCTDFETEEIAGVSAIGKAYQCVVNHESDYLIRLITQEMMPLQRRDDNGDVWVMMSLCSAMGSRNIHNGYFRQLRS